MPQFEPMKPYINWYPHPTTIQTTKFGKNWLVAFHKNLHNMRGCQVEQFKENSPYTQKALYLSFFFVTATAPILILYQNGVHFQNKWWVLAGAFSISRLRNYEKRLFLSHLLAKNDKKCQKSVFSWFFC